MGVAKGLSPDARPRQAGAFYDVNVDVNVLCGDATWPLRKSGLYFMHGRPVLASTHMQTLGRVIHVHSTLV
eukprot:365672-Chlamydomonas_euryale.AAC.7